MSPRTGRPKSEDPKRNLISIRLTDEEAEYLDKTCEAMNMNQSDLIRYAIEKVHEESFTIKQKNK